MSICRAYLSIFPSERGEEIVRNIKRQRRHFAFRTGKTRQTSAAHHSRTQVFIDDSLDYAENIDRLLKL